MCDIINRYLAVNVNDRYGVKINYHILYFLGFYDYLIANLGEERVRKILTSYRDTESISDLMDAAKKYDLKTESVSHLKKYLMTYIKED